MVVRAPNAKPIQSRARGVHILLRDGDIVEGGVYLTDGQALAPYLGSRKNGWMNIVNAVWLREGELHNHAVIQTDHVVIASASRRDIPVVAANASGSPRPVDVLLEDGTRIQGSLHLGSRQRLSDYLASCGSFMGLLGATRVQDGDELGDIAVNSGSVKAVRDAKVFATYGTPTSTPAGAPRVAARRTPIGTEPLAGPVDRQRVRASSGDIDVITPAYPNDRRSGAIPYVTPVDTTQAAPPPPARPLTPKDAARAESASHHWLVRLAVDANLLPPDPRDLSDALTLEEIWSGIAKANEMAEGELAVVVASSYQLDMADLDDVTPEAVLIVPEKIAKRLGALPLKVEGKVLTVAVSNPESLEIEQQLSFATRLALRLVIATPADLSSAIDWHYRSIGTHADV